jgi:hypothetical protein
MQQAIDYSTLFGRVVMQINKMEDQKRRKEEAKHEKETDLFEMIDDYIEQA